MSNEVALPNFKEIGNAAIAREVGTGTTPTETPAAVTTQVATPATPTQPVTQTQTPNTTPAGQTATPVAVPGQAPVVQGDPNNELIAIDFGNGRIEKFTQAQIRDGFLRQQDYTRKTQEAAEQRRQIEQTAQQLSQYGQQVEFAQRLLSNPQQALQWAQSQLAQQTPQLPADPNQPLTVGQAQQLMTAMDARLQNANRTVAQQLEAVQKFGQQFVEDRLQVANFGTTINQTLDGIYQKLPVLKLNPNFEDMIRYEVAMAQPQTLEETTQLFEQKAQEFATNLENHYRSQFQKQQEQVNNLAKTGIELPGGSALPVQQQSFVKNGKLDWNSLKGAVKQQYGGN